jgi:hypothetical protein
MAVVGHVVAVVALNDAVVVVDVTGIGAGVVDRLRELSGSPEVCGRRINVDAFIAAAATSRKDRSGELGFVNRRSAAWWNLREMLDPAYQPTLALPPDDLLTGDLTAPRHRLTSGAEIAVESKDDVAKRIGRSTDAGDAVAQVCDPDPTIAVLGLPLGVEHRGGASFDADIDAVMPITGNPLWV